MKEPQAHSEIQSREELKISAVLFDSYKRLQLIRILNDLVHNSAIGGALW